LNRNRERDFRQTRRRGFLEDDYTPMRDFDSGARQGPPRAPPPVASGPPLQATVKWFNPEKGFGFVQLADGSGDAFLHVSVLERSGNSSVLPGATLELRAGPGQRGMQVTEVLSIDNSTAMQEPARRPRPEPRARFGSDQASVEEFGTVKFYNPDKGFGFISRDQGGNDVFVHASALRRAGVPDLAQGQRVAVDIVEGRKGPEVGGIRLI